jgi:hypothetical protein
MARNARATTMLVLISLSACVYLSPSVAEGAPICGTRDANSGQTVKGTLTLDDRAAVTEVAFKRHTGHKTLALTFNVAACELAGTESAPTMTINPRKGVDDLPAGAVKLKSVTPDGSSLDVLLDVNSDGFDPGSYGGFVVLRAPYMATTRTPVAVSRSDQRFFVPVIIGLVAATAAFVFWTITRWIAWLRTTDRQSPRWGAIGVVFGVAVIGGAIAAFTTWINQDVWTFGDNGWVTATTAFAAATSGALAGLLANLWPEPTASASNDHSA